MPSPDPTAAPAGLLSRVLEPTAPLPLKLAAARGALPLTRQDLALALVKLAVDSDPEVASQSRKSLDATPKEVVLSLLRDPRTDPAVLEHFARREGTGLELLAAIIIHASTPDEILLLLATSSDPEILNRIVTNESRLLRTPGIARALKENPALSRDARRRIGELELHLLGQKEIGAVPVVGEVAEAPPVTEFPVDAGALPPEAPGAEEVTDLLEVPLTPEEEAAEEALRRTPLYQRVVRMNVADKVQAAMKGNAEERAILIRDPSRLVAVTVLKSPKVNEQEIESYANLRNVSNEVLRIIGTHRDWTKSYAVAHALARNPRTPTGVSLTMLNRLTNRDLKNLGTDKNIPDVIRRSAKRIFDLRTKPPEKGKRK